MRRNNPPPNLGKSEERRHSPRHKVNSLIYLNVQPDNGGILLDFSESGMCVSVANPLPVASQIHFSLGSGEHGPLEGSGRISWLSGSGRRAGVEFVQFPNDSRRRIREWLARENLPTMENAAPQQQAEGDPVTERERGPTVEPQVGKTNRGLTETVESKPRSDGSVTRTGTLVPEAKPARPSQQMLSPPQQQPHAMPPEVPTPLAEGSVTRQRPETPLFFLSQRQRWEEDKDLPKDDESSPCPTGNEEDAKRTNGNEQIAAFRSAIASRPGDKKEKERDRRLFRNALIGVALSAALLGLGVVGTFYHPNFPSGFEWLTSIASPPPVSVLANTSRHSRPMRQVIIPAGTPQRTERGGRPARDVTTFYASRPDEARFPATRNDSTRKGWLATVTSESTVPNQLPPGTGEAKRSALGEDGPAKPAVLSPPMVFHSQLTGQTGALHSDGALVVEGGVTNSLPNSADETSFPKPIVVKAVIGKDGRVKDAWLVSSPASRLAEAVVEAVRHWHYQPFYRNGQSVEFTTRITFAFSRLDQKP